MADGTTERQETTSELVPSVSIPNLVAKRNSAVEQIRAAHKALRTANDLNKTFFGSDDLWEGWAVHLYNDRHGAHNLLNAAGWMKGNLDVTDTDLRYLTIRGFKNGNAHVTFLRADLVDALNKIIAKRYPNALPPARECM